MERKLLTLIRIRSASSSRLHMVDRDQFFIGRASESEIIIADASVSRKHAMIEINGNEVFITDLSSSNGSFVGDNQIVPNKRHYIASGTEVRLGRSAEVMKFELMERPIEFSQYKDRLSQFTKDLESISEGMFKEVEAQALREVEVLKKQMLVKVDEEIKQMKSMETQAVQARIAQEIEKQREKIHEELSEYRSKIKAEAVSEADEILLASHNEVLKLRVDFAEEYKRQLEEAQKKSSALVRQAEERAERLVQQARETNEKWREKARKDQDEILQKARMQSAELIANAQKEAANTLDFAKKHAEKDAALSLECVENEIRRMKEEAENDIIEKRKQHAIFLEQFEKANSELEKLRSEKINLADTIQEKGEQLNALVFENERQHELNKKLERLENELKQLDVRKVQLQEENAKNEALVREMHEARIEELDKACAAKEKQLSEVIAVRARTIAQKVEQSVLNEILQKWPDGQTYIPEISRKITDEMMGILATDTFDKAAGAEKAMGPKFLRTKAFRLGIACGVLAIFALLYGHSKNEVITQDKFTEKLIEKQREDARFKPAMNKEYRATYTDNILYNLDYVDLKLDEKMQNQWALNLNKFFLDQLKLNEEHMVRFIGLESSLIKRLITLRDAIDARNLEEGLQRMRDAENEDMENIERIMKNQKNYLKLRMQEKRFLTEMRAQPELRAPAKTINSP